MPRRFNPTMFLSLIILLVSITSVVQAQFHDSPALYGDYRPPHSHHVDPNHYPHHFHSHSQWDHGFLIDEPAVIRRSIEPIGNNYAFQKSLACEHAATDATFGGCPNAMRCPHDARNFASLHEPPLGYVHAHGSTSPATRHPQWQTPLRSTVPNANAVDNHYHDDHNHSGHDHGSHEHDGHSHTGDAATHLPSDRDPITSPSLSDAANAPSTIRSPSIWSTGPRQPGTSDKETQIAEPPIVMDDPPPRI
ncbi:hypothetical protein [Rhodopirellula bahusiensis]